MPSRSRSIVESNSILYALESMRQAKPLGKDHPLNQFLFFTPPYTLTIGGTVATETRIFRGLARYIKRRLDRHRKRHNIPCYSVQDRSSVIAALQRDFRVGNAELEAWSVLYHRFVEIDLDLSLGEISRVVQQTVRTLNRRQHVGIFRLTHELIRREMQIRRKQRQAYLRASLFSPKPPFIVGRDSLLQEAIQYLHGATAAHLVLCGENGVGKSTFALALAHRLIDTLDLYGAVWIDTPFPSLVSIMEEIGWRLHMPQDENSQPLALSFQTMDTLIVIDNAQSVLDDPSLLAALTAELGCARLILCVERLPNALLNFACLPIPDLDKEAALSLLEHYARELNIAHRENLIDVLEMITRDCGGNPQRLRAALLSKQYTVRARLLV